MERFRENLSRIIKHPSLQRHSPKIILITPPPVDEYMRSAKRQISEDPNIDRTASQTAEYADAVREVGKHLKVAVLDIWTIFMQMAGWRSGDRALPGSKEMDRVLIFRELLHDGKSYVHLKFGCRFLHYIKGLHLDNLGYRVLFKSLLTLIEDKWPQESEEITQFAFPTWNDEKAWANLNQS